MAFEYLGWFMAFGTLAYMVGFGHGNYAGVKSFLRGAKWTATVAENEELREQIAAAEKRGGYR